MFFSVFHAHPDTQLESNVIQRCLFLTLEKLPNIWERMAAWMEYQIKLLLKQVLLFFFVHSIWSNKTKKSTCHILSKIIHKMFALFKGISNKCLVLFSLLPFFSFMKMMTHSSAPRRAGSGCSWGAHLCCSCGKKPRSESRSFSASGGKYLSGNPARLSVLVRTELGWT